MAERGSDQPNQPETYLTPTERRMVNRVLGFPEEFPHKFIAWLDDHLRVNVPQFPVTQIRGFQDFLNQFQEFILGEGASWPFIEGKGDLIVGYEEQTVTILSSSAEAEGNILVVNSMEESGLEWVTPAEAISGLTGGGSSSREIQVAFGLDNTPVSAGMYSSFGITSLLAPLDITDVRAFVYAPGSTDTEIDVVGKLSTPITIPDTDNWDDETAVIDVPAVSLEDIVTVSVSSAGAGAAGLRVIVTLS